MINIIDILIEAIKEKIDTDASYTPDHLAIDSLVESLTKLIDNRIARAKVDLSDV